jgi:hypothetical protein
MVIVAALFATVIVFNLLTSFTVGYFNNIVTWVKTADIFRSCSEAGRACPLVSVRRRTVPATLILMAPLLAVQVALVTDSLMVMVTLFWFTVIVAVAVQLFASLVVMECNPATTVNVFLL